MIDRKAYEKGYMGKIVSDEEVINFLQNENRGLKKEIAGLKAEIEKMKCCSNCSHFDSGNCTFSFRTKDNVTPFIKMHEDFFCIDYNKWRSKCN